MSVRLRTELSNNGAVMFGDLAEVRGLGESGLKNNSTIKMLVDETAGALKLGIKRAKKDGKDLAWDTINMQLIISGTNTDFPWDQPRFKSIVHQCDRDEYSNFGKAVKAMMSDIKVDLELWMKNKA